MGKFIKTGKVVIVLNGRYAGRKAVVIKTFDDGSKDRKFGHALVAGIDRAPRRLIKSLSDKKKERRLRIKPFVKFVNYNHVMPTRYNLDVSEKLAAVIPDDSLTEKEKAAAVRKDVKATLEERYKNLASSKNEKVAQGVHYFFRRLRF